MVNARRIQYFWKWSQSHISNIESISNSQDPFWDAVLDQLQRINKNLWFELSRPDTDDRELVLTVEGRTELFSLVEEIITQAPQIPGWKFIALKPPSGFGFRTNYEGILLDPRTMWFLPLENISRPGDLGLRIAVPDFDVENESQIQNAVSVVLDTGLGEKEAALRIQRIEVCPVPEYPEREGYIELTELPKYLEWIRNR
jgi:hypothetical protein